MGNRSGKREEKKEPPRDTPAYQMFKLHGAVAVEQDDCWVEWMLKDDLPWPRGGSFDLPVVQNLREELLRRHKPSTKETPVNWLAFGIWQEEAIKRSSTAKQATLAGKVLKLQGQLEGADRQAKGAAASAPAPSQITGHGSSSVPMSAAPGQGYSNTDIVPSTPQPPAYQPLGLSQSAAHYQLFDPSTVRPYGSIYPKIPGKDCDDICVGGSEITQGAVSPAPTYPM